MKNSKIPEDDINDQLRGKPESIVPTLSVLLPKTLDCFQQRFTVWIPVQRLLPNPARLTLFAGYP